MRDGDSVGSLAAATAEALAHPSPAPLTSAPPTAATKSTTTASAPFGLGVVVLDLGSLGLSFVLLFPLGGAAPSRAPAGPWAVSSRSGSVHSSHFNLLVRRTACLADNGSRDRGGGARHGRGRASGPCRASRSPHR